MSSIGAKLSRNWTRVGTRFLPFADAASAELPLGRLFRTLRGISGSSILGNGEVALILDVVSLGELITGVSSQAATA